MSVRDAFADWLRKRNLSERTIKEYLLYYEKLLFIGGGRFNQSIADELILKNRNQMAIAFLRNLKKFFLRNAVETELDRVEIDVINAIEIEALKSKPRQVPKTISQSSVFKIHDTLDSEGARLMLLLTYYSGLRANELLKLVINDFNWEDWLNNMESDGMLTIQHGKGDKFDIVPIKAFVMERVYNWVNENFTPENTDPNKTRLFEVTYDRWNRILKQASIKALNFPVNPHLLRHSIATHLRDDGWDLIDIKEFLRHSDIGTTQIYAHSSKEKLMEKYKTFN